MGLLLKMSDDENSIIYDDRDVNQFIKDLEEQEEIIRLFRKHQRKK